ncbi:MAG: phenylacetate--CoA ligase family protein [Bacillota bacterium]|nr:phenylacetate--CoA ligase family protein [Bacillota bacterium]
MSTSNYWNSKTELMSRENLEALQLKKLKVLVRWAYNNSPLWKRKLDEVAFKPDGITSLEDIKKIPFLTRKELSQSQSDNPLFGDAMAVTAEQSVRYHQTSGTSGSGPLRILDGWKDWEWGSEMWCYGMYAFGVRETDICLVASGYGNFIGFWLAHYACERLGALTLPTGGMTSQDRINKIMEMGVTVLVSTPTYAIRLAQVANEMGVDLAKDSKVKFLIHAGEPGASIPGTKKMLEDSWGAKVGDFPGMSETGGSTCYECSKQSGGLHILEDHYIQEVIDPRTTENLGYGQRGELVLTSFGRGALPLIRYRTGDLVERVESSFCSCGRTFDLYKGGILGRADDMKLVKGVNIFPSAVEDIVREFNEVSEFQIIIYTEKDIDQVKVKIEPLPEYFPEKNQYLQKIISEKLYNAHRLSFYVEIVEPGALPKFELKSRRLQDLRNKQ